MYEFSREIKKYEVYYQQNGERRNRSFVQVERAIDFAREKMNEGADVDLEEIVTLVGWY